MRSHSALLLVAASTNARAFAPPRARLQRPLFSDEQLRTWPVASVPRGGATGGVAPAPLWGVLGVTAMLLNAVKRVLPAALEPFSAGLGPAQWAAYGAVTAAMAYVEGYKAFHLKFSPMVVARAQTLRGAPVLHALLGPLYALL